MIASDLIQSSAPRSRAAEPEWLTAGAAITVRTAAKRARERGRSQPLPVDVFAALLERPGPAVRDFLKDRGASVDWLSDAAQIAVHAPLAAGTGSTRALLTAAVQDVRSGQRDRADDLSLLRAAIECADTATRPLFVSAGLLAPALHRWPHGRTIRS